METNKESRYEEENKLILSYLAEQDLKKKYAAILANEHNVYREKQPVIEKRKHVSWLKYAAAGILIIASILVSNHFLREVTPQQMALENIRNTQILGDPSSMRKDNAYVEQMRIEANYAFINKNFDESIRLFHQIVNSDKVDNVDYFYLGVSYLKGSNPQAKAAIDAFDKIAPNSVVVEETKWFMALAYLFDGDNQTAKTLLNEIITAKSFKHREATELIRAL